MKRGLVSWIVHKCFSIYREGYKVDWMRIFFKVKICLPSWDNRIHFQIRSISDFRQCHQCCGFVPIAMDAHMRNKFDGIHSLALGSPYSIFPLSLICLCVIHARRCGFLLKAFCAPKFKRQITVNDIIIIIPVECIFEQLKFIQNMCISSQQMSCGRCCYANVKICELILIFYLHSFFQSMILIWCSIWEPHKVQCERSWVGQIRLHSVEIMAQQEAKRNGHHSSSKRCSCVWPVCDSTNWYRWTIVVHNCTHGMLLLSPFHSHSTQINEFFEKVHEKEDTVLILIH